MAKKCLLSGFERVIIVATGGVVFEGIERALVREGLLIPGRVELVMANSESGGDYI